MKKTIAVLFLALAPSFASADPGLTGEIRSGFLESAFKICFKKQISAPRKKSINVAKLAQYCLCYTDQLADRISPEDNKSFDGLFMANRAELKVKLQPMLETIQFRCASTLSP